MTCGNGPSNWLTCCHGDQRDRRGQQGDGHGDSQSEDGCSWEEHVSYTRGPNQEQRLEQRSCLQANQLLHHDHLMYKVPCFSVRVPRRCTSPPSLASSVIVRIPVERTPGELVTDRLHRGRTARWLQSIWGGGSVISPRDHAWRRGRSRGRLPRRWILMMACERRHWFLMQGMHRPSCLSRSPCPYTCSGKCRSCGRNFQASSLLMLIELMALS